MSGKGGLYVSACLVRIALPAIIITCVLARQTALSASYLGLLLVLPYIPLPNSKTIRGSTGRFLIAAILISTVNLAAQVSFQIYLLLSTSESYQEFLPLCGVTETILRQVGLIRLDGVDVLGAVLALAPDVLMLISSVVIYLVTKHMTSPSLSTSATNQNDAHPPPPVLTSGFTFLTSKSKYLALVLLLVSGALRPSVTSGIYYLVFLVSATWWAGFKDLGRGFVIVCRIVSVIAAAHASALLAYQTQYFQQLLVPKSEFPRYFGLTAIRITNCTDDPRTPYFEAGEWATFVNPVAILLLYYVLALQGPSPPPAREAPDAGEKGLSRTLSQRLSQRRLARNPTMRWRAGNRKVRGSLNSASMPIRSVEEHTPLISTVGAPSSSRYRATSIGSGIRADAHGSVTISDQPNDAIPLSSLQDTEEEEKSGCLEMCVDAVISIFQLLVRSSYIANNIIMMTWSITYHSWLTFVLLLAASVLWMIPNQRRTMLAFSPYIVIYAELLLIGQYIFGMDLTEQELPSKINGVDMNQIGFSKSKELPVLPILVKTMFTVMFWITLRQFCRERWEKRQTSALADMAAPFRVSVSTASAGQQQQEGSAWVSQAGQFMQKFMTKFWIWVVAISLFVIGITGNRITVFRIVYMGLFLIFILTFQISYRAWRRMMYGFWLTVIIYSMCILVLVYTYQFEHFPEYWADFLHIPQKLQEDIGLERFETADLFVKLLAPTFFVVITVVQLHYFHRDFLEMSDLRNRGTSVSRSGGVGSARSDGSSVQPEELAPASPNDNEPLLGEGVRVKLSHFRSLRHMSSAEVKLLVTWCNEQILAIIELVILFLELHMLKIVQLSIVLLCCYNVTATHVALVLLCVVSCLMGSRVQNTLAHVSSVFIAFLLLLTMIYQIEYINQEYYISNCTIDNTTAFVANNSEWLGFTKTAPGVSLVNLLQGYIGVCAVITAHAVINTRQRIRRQEIGRPIAPRILFPGINREMAESNIRNCLKFLVNYGFYKFGIEVCLMAVVGLIGSRMDVYALVYACWLCALFAMPRVQLASLWNSFRIFIACSIVLQYLLVVGAPPGLCIEYPWYWSGTWLRVQKWAFLPDPRSPPSAYKLVCDFLLLLLVSRQALNFRIEWRHRDSIYPGGSNESVCDKYYQISENPYLDHMTYTKSWLDLVKKGLLSGMLWITLAVTFTAGTSRVNIFSLGYLIGSFIFLWQGNDLYLRPIHQILKWWNILLGYNVAVVLIKTLLQIPGCIFLQSIESSECWVVQLLGIGCVSKFGDLGIHSDMPQCSIPNADIGLAWDGVCFAFLLMQRRFFNSYYFFHHIDEAKAMAILQSRGAELIEELRQHQLAEQQEQERKVLEKIRHKMDRIKASQQKVMAPKETDSHYQEQEPLAPLACHSPGGVSSQGTPHGYHTPISEEEEAPRSFLQPPTPCSAVLTVSLDAYLEPHRLSFSSPPVSELNPRMPSPEESFPVFSPPPYRAVLTSLGERRAMGVHPPPVPAIGPPLSWFYGTPRHSIVSASSHHTWLDEAVPDDAPTSLKRRRGSRQRAIRSGDYYMFDDDEELDLIREDDDESQSEMDELMTKGYTMSKFLSTAMKTDINVAADKALAGEGSGASPAGQPHKRRSSMPASVLRRVPSVPRRPPPPSVLSAPSDRETPHQRYRHSHQEPENISAGPSLTSSPALKRRGARVEYVEKEDVPPDISEEGLDTKPSTAPAKGNVTQRLWQSFKVVWAFVESIMISLIQTMNRISRDYRYVVRVLAQEKRELKEGQLFKEENRTGSTKAWKPRLEVMLHLSEIMTATSPHESVEGSTPTVPIEALPLQLGGTYDENRKVRTSLSPSVTNQSPSQQTDDSDKQKDLGSRHLPNIRIIGASRDTGLDDTTIGTATARSSEPESGKEEWSASNSPVWLQLILSSWYAIISHSELVCYFAIFIHQVNAPTLLSLPLPLMVFLWGSLTMPRPTKTFWITLISYTEVVVVVKFLFQFEIWPWNETSAALTNPFYPPRIIGVEKKTPYASSDLQLLLIIFFHRYMLKSLGLWKSSYEEVASSILQSSAYQAADGGTRKSLHSPLSDGDAGEKDCIDSDWVAGDQDFGAGEFSHGFIFEKSDSMETAELSPSQETVGTLGTVDTVDTVETGETVVPGGAAAAAGDRSRGRGLMCIGRHSSVRSEEKNLIDTLPEETAFHNCPHYFNNGAEYCSNTKDFFSQLLDPGCRLSADVYAYMFICDFFNFLVVLFGFSAFGTQQGDGGVSTYLEENKVPIPFLLMMILQFALIIIDRALYLRKYILGKIIFQFMLVIGVHIWMFFILPSITERQFNALLPPQMWYMVKCFYMLMSAYQIRAGYPARILGNFLCKKYNYINMFSFRGFMTVPFLFELRALMDWIWTDTSMTLSDWLKMEDIFAQIFQLKCQRRAESEYPLPRGQRKSPISKYFLGGAGLFLIIAVIWFPLVLFALGNTVGEANVPYEATITLRFGAYQFIYEMSAENNTIHQYREQEFNAFEDAYKKDREALTFLSNYQYDDVAVVKMSGNSTVVWGISPPDRELLLQEVLSNKSLSVKFSWKFSRLMNNADLAGTVHSAWTVTLPGYREGAGTPREQLANMLTGNDSSEPIIIRNIFPKFIKVTNKGGADALSKFMEKKPFDNSTYRDLAIRLRTGDNATGAMQQWWEVQEICNDTNYFNFLSKLPRNQCQKFLTLFTFNDKTFPATLSFISGKGIIGLYVSIVFVMSTIIRGQFSGISNKIMFDDMPNVDRILQLCLDIYLVRESNEFALEEDLFAKLVFLYRSPETIIKWTREPDDGEEDADGSPLPSIAN